MGGGGRVSEGDRISVGKVSRRVGYTSQIPYSSRVKTNSAVGTHPTGMLSCLL